MGNLSANGRRAIPGDVGDFTLAADLSAPRCWFLMDVGGRLKVGDEFRLKHVDREGDQCCQLTLGGFVSIHKNLRMTLFDSGVTLQRFSSIGFNFICLFLDKYYVTRMIILIV